jgi:hypothetical protein
MAGMQKERVFSNLIGKGARADVYESNGHALKVFHKGYEKANAFYEAAVHSMIEGTGLPMPKIYKVWKMDDRWTIEMDLVRGKAMYEWMERDPGHIHGYMADMADLQCRVQATDVRLPVNIHTRLRGKIAPGILDDARKEKVLGLLDSFPVGNGLCHNDFHVLNIIKNEEGLFIIDWIDAANGNPEADACRSYLLYQLFRPEIAGLYLDAYCTRSGIPSARILRWFPVMAAARLAEGFQEEVDQIMEWVDRA